MRALAGSIPAASTNDDTSNDRSDTMTNDTKTIRYMTACRVCGRVLRNHRICGCCR